MAWDFIGKSLMSLERIKVLQDITQLDILHNKMMLQNR